MNTAFAAFEFVVVLTPLMLLHHGYRRAGGMCSHSAGRSVAQPIGRATITGTAAQVLCGLVVCHVSQGRNRYTEHRADGTPALLEER
jgi:hypothetical protein